MVQAPKKGSLFSRVTEQLSGFSGFKGFGDKKIGPFSQKKGTYAHDRFTSVPQVVLAAAFAGVSQRAVGVELLEARHQAPVH